MGWEKGHCGKGPDGRAGVTGGVVDDPTRARSRTSTVRSTTAWDMYSGQVMPRDQKDSNTGQNRLGVDEHVNSAKANENQPRDMQKRSRSPSGAGAAGIRAGGTPTAGPGSMAVAPT